MTHQPGNDAPKAFSTPVKYMYAADSRGHHSCMMTNSVERRWSDLSQQQQKTGSQTVADE
jgi:hypothetical protein